MTSDKSGRCGLLIKKSSKVKSGVRFDVFFYIFSFKSIFDLEKGKSGDFIWHI